MRRVVVQTPRASSLALRRFVVCCAFGFVGLIVFADGRYSLDGGTLHAAEPDETEKQTDDALVNWQKSGLPLMQSYCTDCHNADLQEGGLDLSPFETLQDLSTPEVRRVLEMVQFGAMPPEDYETPEIEERKQLVAALEATMYSATCDLTPRAGKVTVRRLNRSEYNNSIRDLFGLDLRPAQKFPSDEVGAGFDNNGDVLSLSPMLIEKYIEAAESISRQVLIDPSELPELDLKVPGDQIPIYGDPLIGRFGGRFVDRYYDVEKTALKNLGPLMRTIFRGPVTEDEIRPYAALVNEATDEGQSYHRGMQIALSALLVSPRFLFRVETPGKDSQPNEFGDVPLTQHQLAARLSYFLWSSTPDQSLMEQADRNQLNLDRLSGQISRMLNDEKADALATDFAAQWLGLRNLTDHEADSQRFPSFGDELKSAMTRETELLFLHVLRNNLSVSEFLTADYSFLNAALGKHYGVNVDDDTFRKVSLAKTPRRGLLSHASILTLTSTPNRTSPVLRGKWILENVLGTKAPEPPVGVPDLDAAGTANDNATLREQLELHRQSPTCASCHRVMDQLGFGLDDFDAIGKYRTKDAGKPIDSSGALPDGRSFNGGVELSKMLSETETEALAKTLVERLLTFAIGRELTPNDRCAIDEIMVKTKPNQFRLADIVAAVVTSRPFRFQTTDVRVAAR